LNDFYTSNYYIGIVKDELGSNVFLYYDNVTLANKQSLIYGKIELQNDVFYIEPSNKENDCFVVYRSRDLANEDLLNGLKKLVNFSEVFTLTKFICPYFLVILFVHHVV
jgi:hypothetical protein